jgi:hypothetical protein
MRNTLLLFLLSIGLIANAQSRLQGGFDAAEYADVLALNFGKYDSLKKAEGLPGGYRRIYTSRVTGLDNRWYAWRHDDSGTVVIGIRGTVSSTKSWLANIYSVMQPAAGVVQLNDSTRVPYRLAANPGAAVHTGWLIALCSMTGDIERKIRESGRSASSMTRAPAPSSSADTAREEPSLTCCALTCTTERRKERCRQTSTTKPIAAPPRSPVISSSHTTMISSTAAAGRTRSSMRRTGFRKPR